MKKYLFSSVLAMFILGCGDSAVDKVKKYTLPQFKSMNIETAIKTSKICSKISWDDISKDGMVSASLTCEVGADVLKAEFDAQNAKFLKAQEEAKAQIKEKVENNLKNLAERYEIGDKEKLHEIAMKFCEYDEKENKNLFSVPVKCDETGLNGGIDGLKAGLKDYEKNHIVSVLKNVAWQEKEPVKVYFIKPAVEVKSRVITLQFVVNTDDTISFKGGEMVQDGKSERIGSGVLARFYKRD